MLTWALAAAFALSAPTPVAAPPEAALAIEPPAQIMALPPELQARLRDEVLAGRSSQAQRLERLMHFLFDAQSLGMTYQEGATSSVAQAYATRKANCLTFTLLFVALAHEAGLDAYPQEIAQTLSWRQDQGTIYRNNHVNARVRIGNREYTVDVAADSVIARDRPRPISNQRLLAHYYNNIAIQHLAQQQAASALRLMSAALELDPTYATHWSNAGVIYLHAGDMEAAEHAYAKALALDPLDAGALFNMMGLARRNGDSRREAEFRKRLERVQQKDPLHHFLQAMASERSGDYPQAIEHYRRAIRLHRREHRFYSALARAYLQSGDTRRAAKALARAEALSDGTARAAYRAQLDGIKQVSDTPN